jgi:hypothetical protein
MDCTLITTTSGCLVTATGSRPVLIHTEFGKSAAGSVIPVATRYTESDASVVITLGAGESVVAGACPLTTSDTEFLLLCDDTDGLAATAPVQFLRRIERITNSGTGALISQTVTNLALDGVTAYTVVGTIVSCSGSDAEFNEMLVCDAAGVTHLRRQTQVNGVLATVGYFNPTTLVATTPTGAVGPCPSCAPKTSLGVVTAW